MKLEKNIIADRGAGEPISLGASLIGGKKVPADAINLLVVDHMEARSFFDWYERATERAEKAKVAVKLCTALTAHMAVEEEIFYPAAAKASGEEDMVRHAVEEHNEGKQIIAQLQGGQAAGEEADALVRQLRQIIEHHVTEEETSFFPRMRRTDLDFFDLGGRIAARRIELLFDLTGISPMQSPTEHLGPADVGSRTNERRETDLEPVSRDEALTLFVQGLRNAHALEENCRTMMKRQIERLENYPRVEARLRQHLTETEGQIARLDTILGRLGESSSGLKDAAMHMQANMAAMMNAPAGDEVLKNSMANYAMANMEIASYQSLLTMGEASGQAEVLPLLQLSLNEERAMAAWLADNLRGLTVMHLQLRSEGQTAKH